MKQPKKLKNDYEFYDLGNDHPFGEIRPLLDDVKVIAHHPDQTGERFWCAVLECRGDDYIVKVNNELICTDLHGLKYGDIVVVRENNIMCVEEHVE